MILLRACFLRSLPLSVKEGLQHKRQLLPSLRRVHATACLEKRVTSGRFHNVFPDANPSRLLAIDQSLPSMTDADVDVETADITRDKHNQKPNTLPPSLSPTGSVVLDDVREYTQRHADCVLLMQVGDFYELYESHATTYAPLLDLKLTRKAMSTGHTVDFAGFPARSLDRYLDSLVNHLGCRVALCEQYNAKSSIDGSSLGIRRRITRIITPGTVIEERFLDAQASNYVLAIVPCRSTQALGLAWIDLSVGEFVMQQQTNAEQIRDDLARIRPREIVLPDGLYSAKRMHDAHVHALLKQAIADNPGIALTYQPVDIFDAKKGHKAFKHLYSPSRCSEILVAFSKIELSAGAALLSYIQTTHMGQLPKLQPPVRFSSTERLRIDSTAITSLELVKSARDGRRADSLLAAIDYTMTSAGARLLSQWLVSPLISLQEITDRQDIVAFFLEHKYVLQISRNDLKQSADAHRALQRLALGRGQHTELLEIMWTMKIIKKIRDKIQSTGSRSAAVSSLARQLKPHQHVIDLIEAAIDQDTVTKSKPLNEESGGLIKLTFDPALARLHTMLLDLRRQRQELLAELQSIAGASVALVSQGLYKNVVEVNASQASKLTCAIPMELVNKTKTKHRYQMDTWTQLSTKIQNTEAGITEVQEGILDRVIAGVLDCASDIIQSCNALAQMDVLASFAWMAEQHQCTRPRLTNAKTLHIVDGRHPVVEAKLARQGRPFIQNDCQLDSERIWLLTGPNMGGKSTFLRQNAVIVILAHMGCYVPARYAEVGLTDGVFSRFGAADNLAQGQSTFMVEMLETADILKHATERSFVIMDEVGRGTSTADGVALAYSILHYLHQHIQCRTLFATHYRELAELTENHPEFSAMGFFMTQLHEDESGRFTFLHKVQRGVCPKSHALHVARLAGIPEPVLTMARELQSSFQATSTKAWSTFHATSASASSSSASSLSK